MLHYEDNSGVDDPPPDTLLIPVETNSEAKLTSPVEESGGCEFTVPVSIGTTIPTIETNVDPGGGASKSTELGEPQKQLFMIKISDFLFYSFDGIKIYLILAILIGAISTLSLASTFGRTWALLTL